MIPVDSKSTEYATLESPLSEEVMIANKYDKYTYFQIISVKQCSLQLPTPYALILYSMCFLSSLGAFCFSFSHSSLSQGVFSSPEKYVNLMFFSYLYFFREMKITPTRCHIVLRVRNMPARKVQFTRCTM